MIGITNIMDTENIDSLDYRFYAKKIKGIWSISNKETRLEICTISPCGGSNRNYQKRVEDIIDILSKHLIL